MGAWDRAKTIATAFSAPAEVHAFVAGLVITMMAGFVDPSVWVAVIGLSLGLYGMKVKKRNVKTKIIGEIQDEPQYYLSGVGLGIILYVFGYNMGYIPDPVLVETVTNYLQ